MFLSIIIPVYNTEKYLDECLQSCLEQDIPANEYEIICVNDGSIDGSLDILRKYEAEASNIVIVNQKNTGVCAARNAGIEIAAGDYIWFIDSDDYIQKNSLAELLRHICETNYDRIFIGNYFFQDDALDIDHTVERQIEGMQVNTSWHDSVVWRSIFNRKYILQHDLYFHYVDLTFGEDALYMYEVIICCPNTIEIAQPLYYNRGRMGSAGTEENSPEAKRKKLVSNLHETQVMQKYYESGDTLPDTADRLMSFLWGTMYRIAELPSKEANAFLKKLKDCGLYPYKRPAMCMIKESHQLTRNDIDSKVFDIIKTK